MIKKSVRGNRTLILFWEHRMSIEKGKKMTKARNMGI
jgi:hypothetical protein